MQRLLCRHSIMLSRFTKDGLNISTAQRFFGVVPEKQLLSDGPIKTR